MEHDPKKQAPVFGHDHAQKALDDLRRAASVFRRDHVHWMKP
jgi:hypothetical protein